MTSMGDQYAEDDASFAAIDHIMGLAAQARTPTYEAQTGHRDRYDWTDGEVTRAGKSASIWTCSAVRASTAKRGASESSAASAKTRVASK